jgi:hypothetical protein
MLRDWLDWHRATLLRKCAGLDAAQLATRAVPPSNLSLLGLVRHMSDTERGWVRQVYRGEQVPDLYYRSDAPDADFEEADPADAEEDFERYRVECRAVDAARGREAGRDLHLPREDHLGALDVAAPRGGVRTAQRAMCGGPSARTWLRPSPGSRRRGRPSAGSSRSPYRTTWRRSPGQARHPSLHRPQARRASKIIPHDSESAAWCARLRAYSAWLCH